jgi:methylenetetrahydrofolate reductase (NADPH)
VKIVDILKGGPPAFSFEFFPPKSEDDAAALLKTAQELATLSPAFFSVTWGAGGSTRRKTLDIVTDIQTRLKVAAMAHLTCVGAGRSDIDGILEEILSRGIENILALRGDPPRDQPRFVPHPEGFTHAEALVAHIRRRGGDFCLGVAGYPEGHPECRDLIRDMDHLKRKLDAGADFVITQLFFDDTDYFHFVERARSAGVRQPIVPGLMPITNVAQLARFTQLCGAKIPPALRDKLDKFKNDPEAVIQLGIDQATSQARDLLRNGAPGVHFYTLNRSRSAAVILKNLRGSM